MEAKFGFDRMWSSPTNDGHDAWTLWVFLGIVEQHREKIERVWNEFFR